MRILITGHRGYIGRCLFDCFCNFEPFGCDAEEGHVYQDLTESFVRSFDAVIHLAAHSTVQQCDAEPIQAFENNVVGFAKLVEQLRPDQVFVYASSASAYSKGRSMYDFTKRSCDDLIALVRPKNSWGLRFGTVCGPSPNVRMTMLNSMVFSALRFGHVMICNPNIDRPILGIGDLLRAVQDILAGTVEAGVQDLCSFNTTVAGLASEVVRIVGCDIQVGPSTSAYDFMMAPAPWFKPCETAASLINDLIERHGDDWRAGR